MIWKNCGKTEKSSFESSSPRSVTGRKAAGRDRRLPVATGDRGFPVGTLLGVS
jgi:hypothetical protein